MNFIELDKEVFSELQKLSHCMRFWRSINNSFQSAPCGHQQYVYFINWIKYLLLFHLVIRIRAITGEEDPDGVTMGKWLNAGSQKKTIDMQVWRKAKKSYESLRSSGAYKTLRKSRDALYAHNLNTKEEVIGLPDQTLHDIFGLVEGLQRVFDTAAMSGMCAPTIWGSPLPANIEGSITDMMNVLENAKHKEGMHEFLLERDSKQKTEHPELY